MFSRKTETASRALHGLSCFAVALAVFLVVQINPAAARKLVENVGTFELENGMLAVVIPDHRAPVVTHMVWYRVGSADERPGESGIAHFLEHLMFQGTDSMEPGEFSMTIARNGGQDNAFTSYDYTGYYQRVARDLLPLVMGLEAERMVNLNLREEELLPERDVVLEERRSRTDTNPLSQLGEQMDAAFYLAHPYGIPVIGWKHEIEQLNQAQAREFYDEYYAPNNAILIVAGDVTLEEVKALAEENYGPLEPNPEISPRVRPQDPPQIAERHVIYYHENVSTPRFRRQYLTPSHRTSQDGEVHALEVLSQIFGGGSTSLLYRELVVEKHLAISAGAWFSGDSLDSGSFGLYGAPAPGTDISELEAAFDAAVQSLVDNGISDEQLTEAKNVLIAQATYAIDSQSQLARIFGVALTSGQTVEDVQSWPERIEAVTREQVEKAARDYLRPERSVTGLLLRAENPSE